MLSSVVQPWISALNPKWYTLVITDCNFIDIISRRAYCTVYTDIWLQKQFY